MTEITESDKCFAQLLKQGQHDFSKPEDLEQYLKSQQEIAARTKARAASAPAAAGAAPTTAATEATPERG